jgi:2'-5' RNA ligase
VVSAPSEGARHGQEGQASARGEEAQEEQGQEGHRTDGDHAADERDPAQLRLFVAVRPPAPARQHLADALGRDPDPRWHLTLAFLGEQPDPGAFDLAPAVAGLDPFPLALSGATRLGQVVATGVRGDTRALERLARAVQRSCRDAGAVLERRRWRPHLTVGRGAVPDVLLDYEGPAWTVSEVELVRSVLGRQAEHTVLRGFALG